LRLASVASRRNRAQAEEALEREARFETPFSASLVAFQQKRYVDAEAILSGLLPEAQRDSLGSLNFANVLLGLGAVNHLQHRVAQAARYYKQAIEIRSKLLKPDDPELPSPLGISTGSPR
jgi:Tetratricopeptide repeat